MNAREVIRVFTAHGLPCVVMRHTQLHYLLGYVRLPDGVKPRDVGCDYGYSVAGGVTWVGPFPAIGDDEPKFTGTWLGFDTAFVHDMSAETMVDECTLLAKQITEDKSHEKISG